MSNHHARESALWQNNLKMVAGMSDKAAANMLKVQMISHGSNAETNVLMETALHNHFFSTSSTDHLKLGSAEEATS